MKTYHHQSKSERRFLNPKPNGKWLPYPELCSRFLKLKAKYLKLSRADLKRRSKKKIPNPKAKMYDENLSHSELAERHAELRAKYLTTKELLKQCERKLKMNNQPTLKNNRLRSQSKRSF